MAVRALRAKLSAVFFALVCANSLIYLALSGTATRLHLQEVDQKLNRSLARNIVAETPLLSDGKVIGLVNRVFVQGVKEHAITDPSGISYAVPIRYGKALLDKLKIRY